MTGSFLLILGAAMTLIVKTCFLVDIAGMASRFTSGRQAEAAQQEQPRSASQRLAMADRPAEPTRAESLAWTLSRSHRAQTVSAIGGSNSVRPANGNQEQFHGRSSGGNSVRRRARQRMALSHARRNER
jgi:hypothetical protein